MSDELREQAEANKILEVRIGSHLYGTNTPKSDEDFAGVFLPPIEYVFGLKSVKEVDLSVSDKNQEGKNTKDAVDRKLYEYRKFISLALQNNPNILEILYVNEPNIIYCNHYGRHLLSIKKLFLCSGLQKKFLGYAKAQKHKMIIRRDHYEDLKNGYEFLQLCPDKMTMSQIIDNQKILRPFHLKEKGFHVHCGDICFEPGVYVKKAKKMLKERLDKATSRIELVLKYGYDTKFGSHLIRLLKEGIEVLTTEHLEFPLSYRQELLDIRNGAFEIKELIQYSEELERQYEEAIKKTHLPQVPNFKEIEAHTILAMREWIS